MKRSKVLICILILFLLCGCRGNTAGGGSGNGQTDSDQAEVSMKVYAAQEYRYALEQAFSHMTREDSGLRLVWCSEKAAADVVLTDCIPEKEFSQYQSIPTNSLSAKGFEQLTVFCEQEIIGIPVFLRLDGLWYDELLYSNTQTPVPQSINTWLACPLTAKYPAVCRPEDMQALFWGAVAPLYISFGGTEAELAAGEFRQSCMTAALEQIQYAAEKNALVLWQEANQKFISSEATFWISGVEQIAKFYNHKSNLSSWKISLAAPFEADEKSQCVVRADILLIRNTVDRQVAERFLKLFYTETVLTDLSEGTKMPLAVGMQYAPSKIPEVAQICYGALASPATELKYVVCSWDGEKRQAVEAALLSLLQGECDAVQAAKSLL